MDIDKIINTYQSYVKDAKPEDVDKTKGDTLNKINGISVLAGLLVSSMLMRAERHSIITAPQAHRETLNTLRYRLLVT